MSLRQAILKQLTASRNVAVERAIEAALADATPAEQHELAEVLLERNQRSGWVAMIRVFNRLDDSIRQKLVGRPRDLFGPLAETMQDVEGPARENVISIVRHCADARLVYLLAEALMDARPEVRELAGKSLLDTVRRHCEMLTEGGVSGGGGAENYLDLEAAGQIRRAVDFALRHFKSHRQSSALLAALIHERQQDSTLWALFQDPYDDITRAATVTLRAPAEAAITPALLLALGSPLKPAAMAGIAAIEQPPMARALAAQSFRLVDPLLREAAHGITHLKLLPALRKNPPWDIDTWSAWLRLIDAVGLQPPERLNWLTSLYEAAPPGSAAVAWKICTLRAIAETGLQEAGITLANAVRDELERVARYSARLLLSRRTGGNEWREIAGNCIPRSPHLSVRRLLSGAPELRPPVPSTPIKTMSYDNSASVSSFEKLWNSFAKLPPMVQHNAARSVATDAAQAEQLRHKLQNGSPQEIAQGLRMLVPLPRLTPFRAQIIFLCGHPDPRLAAMAVRLVGRLEDPRLKDLLDAAMRHSDPRVRANAIESSEELHIADKSQQILAMLNSRHSRERANAIKAMGQFNFATARECLVRMLTDPNPLHRMSALWVVGQLNLLDIMRQVSLVARRDPNLRVRHRAAEMLETLSGNLPSPL